MDRPSAFTRKVNFYVSIAFILAFGILMTVTIVHAINKDEADLKYLSVSAEMSQLQQ